MISIEVDARKVRGWMQFFPFSITSRDKSIKNSQWSDVVTSLNLVMSHRKTVVSITNEQNIKLIL